MPRLFLLGLLAACTVLAWNQEDEANVNSRYKVESVHIGGFRSEKVSSSLKSEIDALVGQNLDQTLLERLVERLRKDLRTDAVSVKVSRGKDPDHVRVEFLVENRRRFDFDAGVPQFSYHSRQGWTGKAAVQTTVAGSRLGFAVLSDGDTEVERFAGIEARFERNLGTPRVRLGFEFDSYHQQWNPATEAAFAADPNAPGGLYRVRQNFQPGLTFVLAEGLTLNAGVSIQTFEQQQPFSATHAANAVVGTVRFGRQWWSGNLARSGFDAEYAVRAATGALASDFSYVRSSVEARYELALGKQLFLLSFLGGVIDGDAPLFDRFVLGNATTLRGWNKFDIAPLGGNRVVHGSAEYRWRWFEVFYDVGSIWITGRTDPEPKQSVGFGARTGVRDGMLLAVAFPIQAQRMDPVFIIGFNF